MKPTRDKLTQMVDKLIEDGQALKKSVRWTETGLNSVPLEQFSEWLGSCRLLRGLLGNVASPWANVFQTAAVNNTAYVELIRGTLLSIRAAIQSGLIVRIEALVLAEAWDSLLDQADHLFENQYEVAAGTLGRAVLEEHLRNWCNREGCSPNKPHPTLNDYNTDLYKAKHLDKLTMKSVEAMIAVGNHAAHNQPNLKREDVERLLRDVRNFLVQHGPDRLPPGGEEE